MGDYKLIDGTGGYYDGWFPEPEVGFSDEFVKNDLDLFQTNDIGNTTKRYRLFNIKGEAICNCNMQLVQNSMLL